MSDETKQPVGITCAKGCAEPVAEEVKALGLEPLRVTEASVEVRATRREQIRLCYRLRCAHRVLVEVARFRIPRPAAVYNQLVDFPWENWLAADGYLNVSGVVRHEQIRDPRFAYLKVKDAVVDRLRQVYGCRPDSGPEDHGSHLVLFWEGEQLRLSFDLAGVPLSKRGYRLAGGPAPLQESLAAAILLTGGWPADRPLVNPMGGSGTLAIEAALLAANIAPGLLRGSFAWQTLKPYAGDIGPEERAAAESLRRSLHELPAIICSDRDPEAIAHARENARRAGVEEALRFEVAPFTETPVPEDEAWVVMNPPYGLRMEDPDLEGLYREIGQWLKQLHTGGRALVITGNLKLSKRFGLKLAARHTLYNGPVECRLLGFDLTPRDSGA